MRTCIMKDFEFNYEGNLEALKDLNRYDNLKNEWGGLDLETIFQF